MNPSKGTGRFARRSAVMIVSALAACGMIASAAAQGDISIPGDHTYPESITSTSDGTVIVGSVGQGAIYRAARGESQAKEWIKPGTNGLNSVLGVLADEKSGTLWVCSTNTSALGVKIGFDQTPTAVKSFDLATGAPKKSYPLPGAKAFCNDLAVDDAGDVYATDSMNPVISRLKANADAFEPWVRDDRFTVEGGFGLDGIALGADGNLYVNTFSVAALYRVEKHADGSPGAVTKLLVDKPLSKADGLRAYKDDFLMIEGDGRLDRVSVKGDKAEIKVLKEGLNEPVAVTPSGSTAWVAEGQLSHLFDATKGKPAPFQAIGVSLSEE